VWRAWWKPGGVPLERITSGLAEMMKGERIPFAIVAHDGDAFLGSTLAIASDLDERPQFSPWVAAVWVEPQHRLKQVGRSLVGHAARTLFARGFARVYLCASANRRNFYISQGWAPIEEKIGAHAQTVYIMDAMRKTCAVIDTPRLRLRLWRDDDRDAFAAMNADAEVMKDLGGPISRAESDAKLDRYTAAFHRRGFGRWAIERCGEFLGCAGVMAHDEHATLGAHCEVGWRLVRRSWGQGCATEAARAALDDAFRRGGLTEVLSYTAPDNLRSQRVMERLGLQRDPLRDFTAEYARMGRWRGLVWVARPA
jgi:RimJ/RimL family protein N-acetyltransferase/GNAT superfamily N-acetyltransferase